MNETLREMVLILKLARRFPAGFAPGSVQPKIVEFGLDSAEPSGGQPARQPIDMERLYRHLTAPRQPSWATIDTNGQLLWSHDRARLSRLFHPHPRSWSTYWQDGHDVLETSGEGGLVYQAWLEENREYPWRPIVHLACSSASPSARRMEDGVHVVETPSEESPEGEAAPAPPSATGPIAPGEPESLLPQQAEPRKGPGDVPRKPAVPAPNRPPTGVELRIRSSM